MNIKIIAATIVAVLAGAWVLGRALHEHTPTTVSTVDSSSLPATVKDGGAAALEAARTTVDALQDSGGTTNASGMYKCVQGGHVSYSDSPCPEGSRHASIKGGAVTVVAAQVGTQTSPQTAPTADQQAQQSADLQEKRIDAIVGR